MNAGFLAELQNKKKGGPPQKMGPPAGLMAALQSRQAPPQAGAKTPAAATNGGASKKTGDKPVKKKSFVEEPFEYHPATKETADDEDSDASNGFFLLVSEGESSDDFLPRVNAETKTDNGIDSTNVLIEVPLAPLIYRACDFTFEKAVRNKIPVNVNHCVRKLGILRALQRERIAFNALLESRLEASDPMEEEELNKTRFLELLSNGGVARKVVEILLKEIAKAIDDNKKADGSKTTAKVAIDGLDDCLEAIENACPELKVARNEIETTQSVSFYPGLGELFCPGSKLVCYPDGMEGSPLGCSCVQSWYSEDFNQATGKTKRRFVLVIEFIVSVGDELVFVAMTGTYQ